MGRRVPGPRPFGLFRLARGRILWKHSGPGEIRTMPDSHSSFRPVAPAAVVGTTLREHVLQGMHAAKGATGEFTSLLNHISLAIRIINSRVRAAGLAGLLGY